MADVLELVEKTDAEVAAWLPGMKADYVEHRVEAGEARDQAAAQADEQFDTLIPGGRAAEGQHVMNAVLDGEVVGMLWMGRRLGGTDDTTWFVFFVEVAPPRRGEGLGRSIMEAAEDWTRAHGGDKIVLNVFGPNVVARSLYDSLGYEVLATNMMKRLGPPAG